MKGAITSDKFSIEVADLIDEFVIHKLDEHVHRSLADRKHINVHRGEGRTNDRGVLGAD